MQAVPGSGAGTCYFYGAGEGGRPASVWNALTACQGSGLVGGTTKQGVLAIGSV